MPPCLIIEHDQRSRMVIQNPLLNHNFATVARHTACPVLFTKLVYYGIGHSDKRRFTVI